MLSVHRLSLFQPGNNRASALPPLNPPLLLHHRHLTVRWRDPRWASSPDTMQMFTLFICVSRLSLVESGLVPSPVSTGSYSTSVNWLIRCFNIRAGVGRDSHINTVITRLWRSGMSRRLLLPVKYFITSEWKIERSIQTHLQVIQRGF